MFTTWVTEVESFFAVVSVIVGAITVVSIIYIGFGSRTVAYSVSGRDIALATLICRIWPWFLVSVAWSHSVWVLVMDIGMLGLIYCGVRAITVEPGVLGSDILLVALIWRTWPWFLVAVDWSHSLWVSMMDVGMLGLMLVRFGWWRHGGHRGDFLR